MTALDERPTHKQSLADQRLTLPGERPLPWGTFLAACVLAGLIALAVVDACGGVR